MRKTLTLWSIMILLCACEREVIVEKIIEKPAVTDTLSMWKEINGLKGERRLVLNSYAFNDSLIGFLSNGEFLLYNSRTLKFVTDRLSNPPLQAGAFGPGSWDISKMPTITSTMLITVYQDEILVIAPTSNLIGGGLIEFNATDYDPGFVRYELPWRFDEVTPVVDEKYLLIPYYSQQSTPQKRFCFLVEVDAGTTPRVTIRNVKKLVFEQTGTGLLNNLSNLSVVNGRFFVSYDAGPMYQVDTTGTIKEKGQKLNGFFKVNNLLFAHWGSHLYVSDDQGENFRFFTPAGDVTWAFRKSRNFGQETFQYVDDNILQVTFQANALSWQALDNTGLERSRITSLAKCGNRVFITTLNGVFYKDWAEFKTPKKKN